MREAVVMMETWRGEAPTADLLRSREEAAATIARLKREAVEATQKLLAVVGVAETKFVKAKAVHDDAARELQQARVELSSASHQTEVKVSELEAFLVETAPPEIDAVIEAFHSAVDEFRRRGHIQRRARPGEQPALPWPQSLTEESSPATVRAALTFCRNVIGELHTLKLAPTLDAQRLRAIIDEVKAFNGEPNRMRGPR